MYIWKIKEFSCEACVFIYNVFLESIISKSPEGTNIAIYMTPP